MASRQAEALLKAARRRDAIAAALNPHVGAIGLALDRYAESLCARVQSTFARQSPEGGLSSSADFYESNRQLLASNRAAYKFIVGAS